MQEPYKPELGTSSLSAKLPSQLCPSPCFTGDVTRSVLGTLLLAAWPCLWSYRNAVCLYPIYKASHVTKHAIFPAGCMDAYE